MRIAGGIYGGRTLAAPQGRQTRPTTDKVRQAVFNMLNARGLVGDAVALDAFCGSGALGFEALSNGAAFCTFFDISGPALAACRANASMLGAEASCLIRKCDSLRPPSRPADARPASLIFLDPPYGDGLVGRCIDALKASEWLTDGAWVVAETEKSALVNHGQAHVEKTYGDTKITLIRL